MSESAPPDHALLVLIGQAACLVAGSVLLLAASVLFIGLAIARDFDSGVLIVGLLNAGIFYLWGMGLVVRILKTWKDAARLEKSPVRSNV